MRKTIGLLNYTLFANIVLQIHCATEYKLRPLASIPMQYGSIKVKEICWRTVSLNLTATRHDAINIDDFDGELQTGKNCL